MGLCICLLIVPVFAFIACNNEPAPNHMSRETTIGSDSTRKSVHPRNITTANACNNLLLDSNLLEKFIGQQSLDSSKANEMRDFYNRRAFQFAWFNDSGFTEQALAFRSLYDYQDSGFNRKSLDNRLDELLNNDSLQPSSNDPQIIATELRMTWRFTNYLDATFRDENKKKTLRQALIPFQKQTIEAWATELNGPDANIAAKNKWFKDLQKALQQLMAIKKNGGWDSLPISFKLYGRKSKPALISRLKKRLQVTGQLEARDTSSVYTKTLEDAINRTQAQFGHPHDKKLTVALVKDLNVPVDTRIQQVIINMERMRWMPELPDKPVILVNIPEFKLYVKNGNSTLLDMDIITGKEGNATVMFSGEVNQLVFSPYWNVPPDIVKKEILPAIKKNKNYLAKEHMEITGERNGLPIVRQLPGEWNELGRIKFLFPNNLHIYFHDTPHKWLFNKDQRAFSHGCIRLAEPVQLAAFLLKNKPEWTPEKINNAMKSDNEKSLKLTPPVPVLIYYYTSWVGADGNIQFRKDIYGHDKDFAKRIF